MLPDFTMASDLTGVKVKTIRDDLASLVCFALRSSWVNQIWSFSQDLKLAKAAKKLDAFRVDGAAKYNNGGKAQGS